MKEHAGDALSVIYGLGDMGSLGNALAHIIQSGHIIGLNGDLGVGKTSLVRAILQGLEYIGDVPSPSYALVQPYDPPALRIPVLHVDLYRLNDPDDVFELGLGDAARDYALFIEWPERLQDTQSSGIPTAQIAHLFLEFEGVDQRRIIFDAHPLWNGFTWKTR